MCLSVCNFYLYGDRSGSLQLEVRIMSLPDLEEEEEEEAAAHRAFGNALLPLAHPHTLLQGGAFLQQQVPSTVRVSGPDTGSAGRNTGTQSCGHPWWRLEGRQRGGESWTSLSKIHIWMQRHDTGGPRLARNLRRMEGETLQEGYMFIFVI